MKVFVTVVDAAAFVEVADRTEPAAVTPAPAALLTTAPAATSVLAPPFVEVATTTEPPAPAAPVPAPAVFPTTRVFVIVADAGPDVEVAAIIDPPDAEPSPAMLFVICNAAELGSGIAGPVVTLAGPEVEVAEITEPPAVTPVPVVLALTDPLSNVTDAGPDVDVAEMIDPLDVPPEPAMLLFTDPPLNVTVAVPVAAVTATIDPPALPAGSLTTPSPAWFEVIVVVPEMVTDADAAAEFTTMTEPPALVPSLVAAVLFVILEFVIVTVVAACPLTETAEAPLAFFISTLLKPTLTAAGAASTLTAVTPSPVASKIRLFKVTDEFEQMMHVPGVVD